MHCENNLAVNILKTILGEKDQKNVQQDLQALGVYRTRHVGRSHILQGTETVMPTTPWVMTNEEHSLFLDTMLNMKFPSEYA
jgi:hypothetical protein